MNKFEFSELEELVGFILLIGGGWGFGALFIIILATIFPNLPEMSKDLITWFIVIFLSPPVGFFLTVASAYDGSGHL